MNADGDIRARYLGGAWDAEHGFRPLAVALAQDDLQAGRMMDVNSLYPPLSFERVGCEFLGHALHTIAGELQTDCLRCDLELDADQIAEAFYWMEQGS
jgi:hypothetical protein